MNEELILNKIIGEAKKKSEEISLSAKEEIKLLSEKLVKTESDLNKLTKEKIEKYREKCIKLNNDTLEFEKRKLALKVKNEVIDEVKKEAVKKIISLKKAELLAFLDKILIKNAENNETLLYNVNGIEDIDLENLSAVKNKNLQVVKDLTITKGIVLSTETYDKNLSFESIVDYLFDKNKNEIFKILF